ncbi:MAG: hypothetical protein GTN40_05245 [Candidatus Aenigmarchaeota archaeon]|nr:hypothetical protein [Candidatus Aenigmarchaeota archaeon]
MIVLSIAFLLIFIGLVLVDIWASCLWRRILKSFKVNSRPSESELKDNWTKSFRNSLLFGGGLILFIVAIVVVHDFLPGYPQITAVLAVILFFIIPVLSVIFNSPWVRKEGELGKKK